MKKNSKSSPKKRSNSKPAKPAKQTALADEVRLQKFLAHCGVCSRRHAERYILDGRISVNGHVVRELGTKVRPATDKILVDGEKVKLETPRLFLFFKPRHVVSTMRDPEGRPCVGDYMQKIKERLYPLGRLDYDVSGLQLFTNDGALAQNLLHPSFGTERVYVARIQGELTENDQKRLLRGIQLDDGRGVAKKINILTRGSKWSSFLGAQAPNTQLVEITVAEGRKHFVKRLFFATGHPVIRLLRIGFGDFQLSGLKEGEYEEIRFTKQRSHTGKSGHS